MSAKIEIAAKRAYELFDRKNVIGNPMWEELPHDHFYVISWMKSAEAILMDRQQFIKYTIETTGYINRKDIIKAYEVSAPQATRDIRDFIKNNPKCLSYNVTTKRYEVSS